jgi:hypothetical protein
MVASNEYEGESYAWGSARLRTVETPSGTRAISSGHVDAVLHVRVRVRHY